MGNTTILDISYYKSLYNIDNYIETGTGVGETLSYSLQYGFKRNISIEIFDQIYEAAKQKFVNTSCEIFKGNSYEVLPIILPTVEGNTFFFLDAHFPGADFGYTSYADEADIDKRLPLQRELEIILKFYPNYKTSLFLIDDLRIYEDGPFEAGNWIDRKFLGSNNIDFIVDLFGDTHDIIRSYAHQGYIILLPKNEIL